MVIAALVKQMNLKIKAPFQFSPKVQFNLNLGDFEIKTANSCKELSRVLKLPILQFGNDFESHSRYDNLNLKSVIEWDMLDIQSDHLLLTSKSKNLLLAGVRINASLFVEDLETEKDFHLNNLLQLDDILLEVNQFRMSTYCCENFDRNLILNSLKFGMIKYGEFVNVDKSVIAFSCAGLSAREGALLFQYFKQSGFVNSVVVKPRVGKDFPQMRGWLRVFDRPLSHSEISEASLRIPSEMKMFLENGSKILSHPSWDALRGCFKFLVSI